MPVEGLKKTIAVSVINDLSTDQRVHRTCMTLVEIGYNVILIGRRFPLSQPLSPRPYQTQRMRLLFTKGPLFYLEFNCRLWLKLIFLPCDGLLSNDLDTLAPNYYVAKWRHKKLFYDAHEIFTEVPELQNHPLKKKVWQRLESHLVPKIGTIITVNQSLAKWYTNAYGISCVVVRNMPMQVPKVKLTEVERNQKRLQLGLPVDKPIVILQGAGININRGAEELLASMQFVDHALLLIIGGGDVCDQLAAMVEELNLQTKIRMLPKMSYEQMMEYTSCSTIGVTLDKSSNLNYKYSLPNKIFDYLFAGIPVLSSRLVELERMINQYQVGDFFEDHVPVNIAKKLTQTLKDSDQLEKWRGNIPQALASLNWGIEREGLVQLFRKMENE